MKMVVQNLAKTCEMRFYNHIIPISVILAILICALFGKEHPALGGILIIMLISITLFDPLLKRLFFRNRPVLEGEVTDVFYLPSCLGQRMEITVWYQNRVYKIYKPYNENDAAQIGDACRVTLCEENANESSVHF